MVTLILILVAVLMVAGVIGSIAMMMGNGSLVSRLAASQAVFACFDVFTAVVGAIVKQE